MKKERVKGATATWLAVVTADGGGTVGRIGEQEVGGRNELRLHQKCCGVA